MALADAAPTRSEDIFKSLRQHNYRLFWSGLLVSIIGWSIQNVAVGWVVLDLTNSPLFLGLVSLSAAVPTIAFTFLGGVAADRVDRRRLIIAEQFSWGAIMLVLAVLMSTGLVQVWHILIVSFLSGVLTAFDSPARQSIVPQLIQKKEDLANAIALTTSVWQLSRILGPAIAGVLISLTGAAICFYITSAGFFIMSVTMTAVRLVTSQTTKRGSMWQNFVEGLSYVYRNPVLTTLIALTFFNSVFGISYITLLPVFARDILDVGAPGLGFLMGASGMGALTGTFALLLFGHSRRRGIFLLVGSSLYGLVLIAFASSTWFPLSLVLIAISGGVSSVYMTTCQTLLLTAVPDDLRGRVMSLYSLTYALLPLGGMQAGTVASITSTPFAVIMGGAAVTCFALFVALRVPQFRALA